MGRSCFLTSLLISSVFALCFYQGLGRTLMTFDKGNSLNEIEVNTVKRRESMAVTLDYEDPGANTNPGSGAGYLFAHPPPPSQRCC